VVVQPEVIPNLVLSVDGFNIKIKNTITELSPTAIVLDCGLGIAPSLCSQIHRQTGNDSLWLSTAGYVNTTTRNIGSVTTKGADLTAHYQLEAGGAGKFDFNLVGTYTKDFDTQPIPGGPSYNCVGYFGATCGAPLPDWRHVFSTTWGLPWWGLDLTARWRYIGGTSVDRSSLNPQLHSDYYLLNAGIKAYNYLDLSLLVPAGDHVEFRVGVNNIADKDPPLIPTGLLSNCPNTTCNDNTWVGTYDTIGRYIYGSITAKF
jgi:iron complex outermembrane recepter protein